MKRVKLYNNLERKKVEFQPITPGEVKFYSCGPTTYDFLHVGNARALVVGDLMHRIFKTLGYKVTFVRNYTDVDDKIINRAHERKVDPIVHADQFVKECEADMRSLNMLSPTHTPKVSETMDEIIEFVKVLEEKGFAYEVDGDVWYEVPKFESYGKLSKKDLEQLQHGIRVSDNDKKRNSGDFALWKKAKEGEPSWDSPWGKGRPGWHIECSAMIKKFLGETIDLHHGGVDLMFPHHENEIAQSEAASGKQFCNHWCHNEFLNFGTEKMSKSLGNVVTIRKFVETYGGEILRYILASVHYRSRLDWSEEIIKKAINDLERIHRTLELYTSAKASPNINVVVDQKDLKSAEGTLAKIELNLANDFNVTSALAEFFSFIRMLNRDYLDDQGALESKKPLSRELIVVTDNIFNLIDHATGLVFKDTKALFQKLEVAKQVGVSGDRLSAEEVEALLVERKEVRAAKNFKRADEIRDLLNKSSIVVKDSPDGKTTWTYK